MIASSIKSWCAINLKKEPDSNDKLTMFVIGISNTSRQGVNHLIVKGSCDEMIIFSPHLRVTCSSDVIGNYGGGICGRLCLPLQNCIIIFSYFQKKDGKSDIKSVVISFVVGIDLIGTRCSTELTAFQSFPTSFTFSWMLFPICYCLALSIILVHILACLT